MLLSRVPAPLSSLLRVQSLTPFSTAAVAAPERLVAYYSDHMRVDLPSTSSGADHRFPMMKYEECRLRLQADASLADILDLRAAPPATRSELHGAHDPGYVERFLTNRMTEKEMRAVGFPHSEQLVHRTLCSAGGTLAATAALLEEGRLMTANVAGGTHHAFRDRGEGFCCFNDIAVASVAAMTHHDIERILVIDLDVHQGNGTASIFQDDERVTTFDVHGDNNYPWKTRRTNTYDVALPDGTTDEPYLAMLEERLPELFERHRPQLLFFQAGVDALGGDSFGRLALTREGLLRRNNLVYSLCISTRTPTVITMGGGYTRPMERSVEAHADVYRTACYRNAAFARSGLTTQTV